MNALALIVLAAVAFGTYKYVEQRQAAQPASSAASVAANGTPFVALPVEASSAGAVMVVAAENCPLEDAQRADRLTADLKRNGIAVQRRHEVSFTLDDPGQHQRIGSVMNGPLPIVFVRGRAKANPTLAEVLAEYKGSAQ